MGRGPRPGFYLALIYLNELGERKRTGLWRRVREIKCVHIVVRLEQVQTEEATKETFTKGRDTSKKDNGPTKSHEQKADLSSEVPPSDSTNHLIEHIPGHVLPKGHERERET